MRSRSAAEWAIALKINSAGSEGKIDGIAVVVRIEGLSRLTRCRVAEPIETVSADAPHADVNLVDQRRGQCRRQVERQCLRMPEDASAEAAGQCFIVGVAGRSLIGVTDAEFIPRVEIVIDLSVELFAAETVQRRDAVCIGAEDRLGSAVLVTRPPESRGVQTIAAREVVIVRQRRLCQLFRNESCRIHSRSIGIPGCARSHEIRASAFGVPPVNEPGPKKTDVVQASCKRGAVWIGCRLDRITDAIYHGNRRSGAARRHLVVVPVIPIVEVAEDAISRAGCERQRVRRGSAIDKQCVPQSEANVLFFTIGPPRLPVS